MTAVLLSVHVLAAILVVGPIAVAASLFPRLAVASPGPAGPAAVLHRICRVYTVVGVVVPVFGIATALRMGVLGDAWLLVSIALTAVAAALLALLVVPDQRRLLAGSGESAEPAEPAGTGAPAALARRLAATTGVFNLLWAVVVVLMIVRPGSSTGV